MSDGVCVPIYVLTKVVDIGFRRESNANAREFVISPMKFMDSAPTSFPSSHRRTPLTR